MDPPKEERRTSAVLAEAAFFTNTAAGSIFNPTLKESSLSLAVLVQDLCPMPSITLGHNFIVFLLHEFKQV